MENLRLQINPTESTYPSRIILPTQDIIQEFRNGVQSFGISLSYSDHQEIVRQIFDLLLNFGRSAVQSYPLLPDMSRLSHSSTPASALSLHVCSEKMAGSLQRLCENLGMFQINHRGEEVMPYWFDGFHPNGGDIAVTYIPLSDED